VPSSGADVVKRYFAALDAHDLDGATSCWKLGAVDRFVGQRELLAPAGVRQYFDGLFAAFPDFSFEVLETVTARRRTVVRWRGRGTFAGPATFQGFAPNGARIEIEGCDVVVVADDLIQRNDAYVDTGDIVRKLGFLPAAGSAAEARLTRLANLRTKILSWVRGTEPERIADGVWIVRGGFPAKTMNVYLIKDGGGVTVFDAGSPT